MAVPLAIPAAISLVPSVFKAVTGIFQRNKAKKINPINPGYTVNNSVIDNATNLTNRANNYVMAGYGDAVNDINSASANAFNTGVQGATNSGDVLDLATKIAYGQGQNINNLNVSNAQGREQAYMQAVNARNMAGQELQNKNAWEREQYMQQLREKAALEQSGTENIYSGISGAASIGANALMPRATSTTTPTNVIPQDSIFSSSSNPEVNEYYKQLLGGWNTGMNRPTVNYSRGF